MKKVRCPKCDGYIGFDETRYEPGQKLVFVCPDCGKQFGIRLKEAGVAPPLGSKVKGAPPQPSRGRETQPLGSKVKGQGSRDEVQGSMVNGQGSRVNGREAKEAIGCIVVIENVFQFKQELPLKMGDNVIGKYHKGNNISTPIETSDPSIDYNHCVINVSHDKNGKLRYILRDGPSNTGTFIDNEILGDRERRVIEDGTVFSIGASSVILKASKP